MKRLFTFLLAFILLLGLTACSSDTGDKPPISNTQSPYVQRTQNTPEANPAKTEIAEKNNITTSVPLEKTEGYIGNKNSKKFHGPSCHTLPEEKNRVYFDTRDEAIQDGYTSCKKCSP